MKTNNKKLKSESGFTLVEIVVTFGIIVFVMVIFNTYITGSYRTISFIDEFNEAVESAKKGINIMNQEIREADNAANGSYTIEAANEQEIIFYSDLDIDSATEKIRYYLDGTELKKEVTEAGALPYNYSGTPTVSVLSQYVQNEDTPIFTYYDENNNLIADPPASINQIRLIHTYLEINVTPERAPVNYAIETNVHIRNLKANY